MNGFRLIVTFEGKQKDKEKVEKQLSQNKFEKDFINKIINANISDLSDFRKNILKVGILYPEYNKILDVRLKSKEKSFHGTKKYVYDNIVKQCLLFDPQMFRSIAKRTTVRSDLNTLELYEQKFKRPLYQFSEEQVQKTVRDLAHDNRLPVTIKSIVKSASITENYIREAVEKEHISNRSFTGQWEDVPIEEINKNNKKEFFSRADLINIINDQNITIKSSDGKNRTIQYIGVILLAFKGVKISSVQEKNEMAQISINDVNHEEKSITVGQGEYRRTIKFTKEEWKIISEMLKDHDPLINNLLVQPFSTLRGGGSPLKRWSLIQRFKAISEKIYNDDTTVSYKIVRQSGLNYLFMRQLLNNGFSEIKATGPIREIAIWCLQQFGDVMQNIANENSKALTTKVNRLRLLANQYEK